MSLKLMYITNAPRVAEIVERSGVDRIFVDMEYIGKSLRQGGMNTVQCRHTVDDVRGIKMAVRESKVMVRCNPIHEATDDYCSSREEIDMVVEAGADIIMLPFFKTVDEVSDFVSYVNGRSKTLLLFETPESVSLVDEILEIDGIDEVFIGLNDLSLGYKKKFMFELLTDGTVETLCEKFKAKGLLYGFGGIAALGKGMLPSEYVIREHYRLGSTCAILSRSFCNTGIVTDLDEIERIFDRGMKEIRELEAECAESDAEYFALNRREVERLIGEIVG